MNFLKLSGSLIAPVALFATLSLLIARPVPAGHDEDHDGLHTNFELLLGTDPFNKDTDGDGLSDGEEVTNVEYYGETNLAAINYDVLSNAFEVDSDFDGIPDGEELALKRLDAVNFDLSGTEVTVLTPFE
ncbi:hypothetical protein GCM10007100_23880 [Roseibacillus persicicus]|uniref:Calcium-binding protein n=2 Tax=Roseibacillus persicicus TaxID=454148 RepID=A0A918TRP9_9BACT|nr:hypothetical protein GCM10007100_23880 [Roseibacillus persicicus]